MTGRIMSRFAISLFAATLATAFVPPARASLNVYWTKDDQVAETAPPGSWEPAGTPLPTAFANEEGRLWLAVLNEPDTLLRKYVHVTVAGPALAEFQTASIPYLQGFKTGDTSEPETVYDLPPIPPGNDNENLDLYWQFEHQPQWERLLLTRRNGEELSGLQWNTARISSLCTSAEWSEPGILDLLDASFDAPGAVIGTPLWTEVWLFPRMGTISLLSPSFTAPPSTGFWSSSLVFTDPDGNPRPAGGIKFSTSGSGLSVFDHFHARIGLTGDPTGFCDVYSYNAASTQYERNRVKAGSLVPGASPWTLILAAMATLAVGVLALRRRRFAG